MSIKSKIKESAIIVSEFLIPIFQYIPTASIWMGIMSIPLISYLLILIQMPYIIVYDFQFFFPSIFPVMGGLILFIYSTIHLYRHKNGLVKTGPYKYAKHPQYLGITILTLGLTLLCLNSSPIFLIDIYYLEGHLIIIFIWLIEVLAYIILAKIEEISLKAQYGEKFLKYSNSVPFMIPFFKLKRKKSFKDKNNSQFEKNIK